ncbi:hypothetical protein HZS_7531 [Henneguya salminicola]|nr:hypothetical protein HZS_7531 [Henneguya salminicola]
MESNEFGSKINEASIVDLKAELYKKELEAKSKGLGASTQAVPHKKSKTLQKIAANTGKFIKKLQPNVKLGPILTDHETEKLKEVASCLDAKVKIYEKLKEDALKGIEMISSLKELHMKN